MLVEPLWIDQSSEKRFSNYTPKHCPGWLLYISIRSKEHITVRCVVYLKHLSALLWETTALRFAARISEAGRMKTRISKIKTLLVPKFIRYFLLTTKRLVILYSKIAIGFARCLASTNVWISIGTVIFFCASRIFERGFIVLPMKLACVMYYDIIPTSTINRREMTTHYYRLK